MKIILSIVGARLQFIKAAILSKRYNLNILIKAGEGVVEILKNEKL